MVAALLGRRERRDEPERRGARRHRRHRALRDGSAPAERLSAARRCFSSSARSRSSVVCTERMRTSRSRSAASSRPSRSRRSCSAALAAAPRWMAALLGRGFSFAAGFAAVGAAAPAEGVAARGTAPFVSFVSFSAAAATRASPLRVPPPIDR